MRRHRKHHTKQILLLEDDAALAKALRIMLEEEGFRVTLVTDGESALKVFDTEEFDLALLDLVTPFRSGFEVLEHIRSRNKKIPIFIISNLSHSDDRREALALGAQKYFVKSEVSLEEIAEQVREMLA